MRSVAIACLVALCGCTSKVQVDSKPSPAASAPAAVAPALSASAAASAAEFEVVSQIPVEVKLAAILRTDPDIIQVCYDPEKEDGSMTEGYLIKHQATTGDDPSDNLGLGWRWIMNVHFSKTVAGTYYTEQVNYRRYGPQYPDVTGLQCKQQ